MYVVILFVLLALFGNVIFNGFDNKEDIKRSVKKETSKYLPPGYVIGIIWTLLFALLGFIYENIDSKKNKNNSSKIVIVLFLIFCILYGPLTKGKSPMFVKKYNYLTFVFLGLMTYVIKDSVPNYIYYLIPFYMWIGYINYLTLMDDMDKINIF